MLVDIKYSNDYRNSYEISRFELEVLDESISLSYFVVTFGKIPQHLVDLGSWMFLSLGLI